MKKFTESDFNHPIRYIIVNLLISIIIYIPLFFVMWLLFFSAFKGTDIDLGQNSALMCATLLTIFVFFDDIRNYNICRDEYLKKADK